MERRDIFKQANDLIKQFRWPVILMCLLYAALQNVAQIHILPCVLLSPIIDLIFISWILDLIRNREPKKLDLKFLNLETYFSAVVAVVIQGISIFFGLCLFIVFGVRWYLGQSQAVYLIKDRPYYSGWEAICRSWELMDGLKNKFLGVQLWLTLELLVASLLMVGVFCSGLLITPGACLFNGNLFSLVGSMMYPFYSIASFLSAVLLFVFFIIYWIPKCRTVNAIFYTERVYPKLLLQEFRVRENGHE